MPTQSYFERDMLRDPNGCLNAGSASVLSPRQFARIAQSVQYLRLQNDSFDILAVAK